MIILPYKMGSEGAKNLAQALNIKRSKRTINRPNVINWGRGDPHLVQTINSGGAVALASGKISFLGHMAEFNIHNPEAKVPIIDFSLDQQTAQRWWEEGHVVFCRTLTRANGGRGIVLADKAANTPIVPAGLYTKYFKNKHEYRIHVGMLNGNPSLIFAQQKKKQRENENVSYKIRNHDNGWVFCTEGVEIPDVVMQAAFGAVQVCGLHFGAVDVGYREIDNKAAVFEINTAPGIIGKTVDAYAAYFLTLKEQYE